MSTTKRPDFTAPITYDPTIADDPTARGHLMYAAARGDQAAARTLKQWRIDNPPPEHKPRGTGTVNKGTDMFASGRKGAGYDGTDAA